MSKQTAGEIIEETQNFINDDSPETEDQLWQFLNDGQTKINDMEDWEWRERFDRFYTEAVYDTGTFTYANASATVTVSGGTFTGKTGWKFALDTTGPFYRIIAVAGNGLSCTLESPYNEASGSGAGVVYKDEYEFPITVGNLIELRAISDNRTPITILPLQMRNFGEPTPSGEGSPKWWSPTPPLATSESDDAIHVAITPVPDLVYNIEYRYDLAMEKLTQPEQEPTLPDKAITALKLYVLYKAKRLSYEEKAVAPIMQEYLREIEDLKRSSRRAAVMTVQFQPYGGNVYYPSPWWAHR